jgi:ZIP family zinc transporter
MLPEGMSVGLLFAMASQAVGEAANAYLGMAFALAIGIGLQNFPEGAAISLPLMREGMSRRKAFLLGSLSGIVEPIFGVAVVLVSGQIAPFMPWLLSFAAGSMIYVVVEELIPEAHLGTHSNVGTLGVIARFVIIMVLDVALG